MFEQQIQTTIRLVFLCQRIIFPQQITHCAAQKPLTVKTKLVLMKMGIRFPDQSAGNSSMLSACSASLSPYDLTVNAVSKTCPVPADPTNTIPTSTHPIRVDYAIQFCPTAPGWSLSPSWVILHGRPETMRVVLPCNLHPKTPLSSEPILPVDCY